VIAAFATISCIEQLKQAYEGPHWLCDRHGTALGGKGTSFPAGWLEGLTGVEGFEHSAGKLYSLEKKEQDQQT